MVDLVGASYWTDRAHGARIPALDLSPRNSAVDVIHSDCVAFRVLKSLGKAVFGLPMAPVDALER